MSVNYVCKHCRTLIGRIDEPSIDRNRLGFDLLTRDEQDQYVQEHDNGDITVRMTCDYCLQAYQHNPELAGLATPLQ
ncbi:anti-sigma-F factor Fin [Paenibacillus aquistagni]|uniref:anti-sigma-F factor Fin n=1 Tax=Paenibacillus aquistagni TaxID=1852522 RepID=UPI00145A4548|nr:anti-sigma-F factor Fin [Paenibacillus aquistagni]NMM55254.1 anti-sigma-F factor Fin family protein [Paenibacillus aquistagni]